MGLGGALLLAILISFPAAARSSGPATVDFFSPEGTVKKVTQVTARFSDPMVAFGDPRQPAPFEIQCPEKGTGRWIDGKNWVFDFARELPAGVRCEFKLVSGLKSLAGKEVTGGHSFDFSTGGPSILQSRPYEGSSSISEDQAFILTLDAEPDESSVTDHVSFSLSGVQERVGVQIVSGKEREAILRSAYRYGRKGKKIRLVLQAKQRFPSDGKVSLVWGKGVRSKTGVETTTDQILPFEVRPPFNAAFSCERENPQAACIPLNSMVVHFSSKIAKDQAQKVTLTGAKGKSWKADLETQEDAVSSVTFKGPFPESTTFQVGLPSGLVDDAGRKLSNADKFPLQVRTAEFPPLAKFSASFGILELKGNPFLPVTVRNLEPEVKSRLLGLGKDAGLISRVKDYLNVINGKRQKIESTSEIVDWLKRVDHAKRDRSVFQGEEADATDKTTEFTLPKRLGPKAFEVVGIPIPDPGFYVVELKSAKLGESLLSPDEKKNSASMYVAAAVLVTNMAVHFKWGHESSLAWVTALDTGKPVAGAAVKVRDCSGQILWQGQTDSLGVARVNNLPEKGEVPSCKSEGEYDKLNYGLMVTAEKDADLAFVHTSWENGIESWRFQIPTDSESVPNIAHTVFDRTLLRAGETVHMKHFLRRHTTRGFAQVPEAIRPRWMIIEHSGTEEKYKQSLKWGADGIAESTWTIPRYAKLGFYDVRFVDDPEKEYGGWSAGGFRVEEFRVPLMKAVVQPPGEPQVSPSKITLDLAVSYLAGGGAAKMPVKFRSQVQSEFAWSSPNHDDYEDYVFANGLVKEGASRRDSGEDQEWEEDAQSDEGDGGGGTKKAKIQSQDLTLDNSGTARATISGLPKTKTPYQVLAELQFNDPNGEVQTVASTFPVFPSKTLVGIKLDSWAGSKDHLKFYVSTVDLKGKPVAGAPVKVELFEKKTYSHRKRIVGGFYAYENIDEIKKIGRLCDGKTDSHGLLLCEGKTAASGNLIVQARSKDDAGNETGANREVWVAGEEDWWFTLQDGDRMDVLPEKKRYEPGNTAKLQVRMPFREATALVAVEREGVMEVYVREVSGKKPYVEVPILPNYAPNVFVSVLALRGRASDVQPTALVDLGKPAYKLGIAEINVGWRAHELKVKVTPDRSVFKVRQKARVTIAVKTADGKAPEAGGEVALAAVDEGLLELMPNASWKLLDAMMGRRGYAIANSTAQMQVIGKRHFGLKALPQGGGGGADKSTRELFDTLLLWKGRVPLNARGEAVAQIPLNDSITSFRIVAIASSGAGSFGTGAASIRTTQDLMLFSGIPPLVRQGDRFRAQFTLRNTTAQPMEVALSAKVTGLSTPLKPLNLALAAGEAKDLGWDINVPLQAESLKYDVEARANGARDHLRVTQKVVTPVPARTFQATITQLDKPVKIAVEIPKDAVPGVGGVQVGFKPSLLSGLSGVTAYMRAYPFSCLEQETSRAVALRDKKLWKRLLEKLPSYLDSDGLAKYWPPMSQGSDVLTSYVLAISHEAGWAIPSELRSRMEAGLKAFVEGRITRYSALPTSDLTIRKIAGLEALSRTDTRLDPKLLTSLAIEPNLWPTSAVIDWVNLLERMEKAPDRARRRKEAEHVLHSRIVLQGTTMGFSTDTSDFLWWLMVSQDENAVRALITAMDLPRWHEEIPRLVRGALARQKHGHWDLTTANAWGVLAMEKFAREFEKTKVAGRSQASLSGKVEKLDWKRNQAGRTFLLPWPARRGEIQASHRGRGKPWLIFQSLAAIPLQAPLWAGYRIQKEIQAVERRDPKAWSRGDIARVRLKLQGQSDMTWVAVTDPIPAGSTVLGNGLGRDSALALGGEKREGWTWPAFEERSFEAYRAYYEWVPRGEWTTDYTIRINNAGVFKLPTTRVEAMYSPEMFGELPNRNWEVGN